MSHRRVVVTGLGALCPVGIGVLPSWQSVLAGQSGIHAIEHLDTEKYSVKICGTVKNFQVGDYMNPKDARKMDVFIQYGMAAGIDAIRDAGLDADGLITDDNAHRYGVAIGSGIGGLTTIENNYDALQKSGPRRISPFFIPAAIINMAAGWLSMTYNLQGPNFATSTACASGTHAIGLAARMIAYGDADVMVAGGAEKGSSALGMTGFAAARALSSRNDEPQLASRPWDKDRDGFVLGDGSAILVLEEYEHAVRRGATIYAELSGVGMSGDAHHMTSPPEDGRGAARAMQSALEDAGLQPEQVSYINAHGTSTPVGDVAETRAIHNVFGNHAQKLAVSSTKSMTGHLLGAAGSLEAVFAIKSLQEQLAPPTINLVNPGEGCDLDFVPGAFRKIQAEHVLSNSFGFGGTNITLAFSKLD
ncbi:3-oxoacyl-ACP synthase [Endozoicomonas montiporae]|uniref:3-oxoacyl-[acyl-carrier-protein] synthase 2 n=2 Tax=Endozoicomonas montiporae TaxID=1027273 RepID=A0A081NA33_9GAMM|nr:beta-ketoacyl-ACP synthase II [Endozoicomonas montiporae]AMO57013.1 beta-ketoacyl synthase [Endozoicomonas montiporae CL-33]KEQ15306.1 3-oxoacyl-ACP synthase [Endozoicomonas montiporae]